MKRKISLLVATDSPYSDSPSDIKYLERQINEYIDKGYKPYGVPYLYPSSSERYPETRQMMIKKIKNN